MFTYTQLYKRAADIIGVNTAQSTVALLNIQADINQGLRLFKNASRRYWTRKEIKADLVANQQFYTLPEDLVRVTTVKSTNGGFIYPVVMVDSEEFWNRLNLVPAMTVGIPTHGFIRGRNELGLYPVPGSNSAGGLIVSYEPRLRDMTIEDTTPTISVVNGSAAVTVPSGTPFNKNMIGSWLQVTDGSDGNWYQIVGFTDTTHITLENVYQGPTATSVASLIGQVPDIPEDYHLGLVYYAAYNYYLKRKEQAQAAGFKSLYEDLLKQYKDNYAAKTTGLVQPDITAYNFNLFTLPPQNISG